MAGVAPGSLKLTCNMGPGGHDGFIEGAMTTMLVFKRLAALAVTIGVVLAGAGIALARDGAAIALANGLPAVGDPGDGLYRLVPHLRALHHHRDLAVRAGAAADRSWCGSTPAPIRRPSRTTHNTLLEVAWTLIPVVILVIIAIPSFRLLFHQLTIPAMSAEAGDVTIKATGKQWYWSLQLSGPRQFRVRFADGAAITERIKPASRGCWRSTTTWSCRSTRTSASSPPAPR